MKHLHDPSAVADIRNRLARLQTGTMPLWGTMSVAQMMSHCAGALEIALGEQHPPRIFFGRLFGPIVKRLALGNEKPIRRNSPTIPIACHRR